MRQIKEIAGDIAAVERNKSVLDAQLKSLNEELREAVGKTFQSAFDVANKLSGDITMLVEDVKLKGKIPKKVSWDNKILQKLASSMPWEKAQKIFDIKFTVPEKNYSAISIAGENELLAQLDAARTVEYGDLKIEITE